MGNRNYKGSQDNRSKRDSRAPGFDKMIMRMLPREPLRIPPTVAIDMPSVMDLLLRLPDFLREAENELGRRIEYTAQDRQFCTFIDELAGVGNRDLLCRGAYLFSESGHLRRTLYVGGAAACTVRHRAVDHLAFKGGKRLMRQALRCALEEQLRLPHCKEDERPYELLLRRALFSHHQWFDAPDSALTEWQHYAVECIASGAFEITFIAFPKEDRLLARALEIFLIDSVLWQTGRVPPLNAIAATVTEDSLEPNATDCITMQQLAQIVTRVKSAVLVL